MDTLGSVSPQLKWRAPLTVMIVTMLTIIALLIYSHDFGSLAGAFLVAPVALLIMAVLILRGSRTTKLFGLVLLCLCVLLTWQILEHSEEIRSEMRWLVGSGQWKNIGLDQSPNTLSGMKCVIWDGWGMFAQDTNVYLVYSPDDALRNYSPSNLSGLPSPVSRVQRLERYWYSVTFYTDEGWDHCGVAY